MVDFPATHLIFHVVYIKRPFLTLRGHLQAGLMFVPWFMVLVCSGPAQKKHTLMNSLPKALSFTINILKLSNLGEFNRTVRGFPSSTDIQHHSFLVTVTVPRAPGNPFDKARSIGVPLDKTPGFQPRCRKQNIHKIDNKYPKNRMPLLFSGWGGGSRFLKKIMIYVFLPQQKKSQEGNRMFGSREFSNCMKLTKTERPTKQRV